MPINREQVEHVARLARLELSEDEKALFEEQLSAILLHAERVTSLETEGVPSTSTSVPLSNVFRTDEVQPPLSPDEALANGPSVEDGHFRVPRILEGD